MQSDVGCGDAADVAIACLPHSSPRRRTRLSLSLENRLVEAKRGLSDSPHGLLLTRTDRNNRQRDDATPAEVHAELPTRSATVRQACGRPALAIAAPSSVTEIRCSRRTTRTRTGSSGRYSSPVSINISLRPCTVKLYAGQDVASTTPALLPSYAQRLHARPSEHPSKAIARTRFGRPPVVPVACRWTPGRGR